MSADTSAATAPRNVDQAELDKFQSLASRWWDPDSEFKPLHEINPLRLEWIREQAGGSLQGRQVIDVGCGGGILAEALASAGATVTGIDLADKSLQVARLHALDTGAQVHYEQIAVEDMAARQPGHFDVVVCMEMLEHVPDPASVVRACAQLAQPGATLTFSTLNRNPKSWLFAIVGAEYVLKLLPKGTHSHDKFIRPAELARLARQAGLDVTGFMGLTYNPVSKQYRLDPGDVSVNYMMACRKPD
ncbi:MAG: bifunctional 2-polyprenyl-6-hydroxyphenol methylase/3-demethylubiquinol 3-O-methyltransferase UbiG [Lautropia sp.]|nr:bifunctional 2-polyprenyl-6-hydroxyphenol methylase/3-demethylubiquinol 3-O-methyltransferase UbiG [Lautropia sp.]